MVNFIFGAIIGIETILLVGLICMYNEQKKELEELKSNKK